MPARILRGIARRFSPRHCPRLFSPALPTAILPGIARRYPPRHCPRVSSTALPADILRSIARRYPPRHCPRLFSPALPADILRSNLFRAFSGPFAVDYTGGSCHGQFKVYAIMPADNLSAALPAGISRGECPRHCPVGIARTYHLRLVPVGIAHGIARG